MSTNDTPRTNALVRTNLGLWLDGSYVDASFARQLERELNAKDIERNALLAANETLKSALKVIVDSLAPSMRFGEEDLPDPVSIGYARGTALRAIEEVAND